MKRKIIALFLAIMVAITCTACNSEKEFAPISAGDDHTVGLKADGTVVAVGSNSYGQCYASDWKNIKTK